jgi:hypothetical protein
MRGAQPTIASDRNLYIGILFLPKLNDARGGTRTSGGDSSNCFRIDQLPLWSARRIDRRVLNFRRRYLSDRVPYTPADTCDRLVAIDAERDEILVFYPVQRALAART